MTVQFRFDEAEAAYREAIHAAPDSFKANFALALFSQQLNRVENARTAYERCLEMARKTNRDDNGLAATLNNLAMLHRDKNRMDEARNEFQEALKIYQRPLDCCNPRNWPSPSGWHAWRRNG